MTPPVIFADWVKMLLNFKKPSENDELLMQAMELGAVSWSEGVAERFADRCIEVLSTRFNEIQRKFNVEIKNIESLEGVANSIIVVRKRLELLVRFASMPSLPEELKEHLQNELKQVVEGMQQGLLNDLKEKSKYKARFGEILVYVKNNPITLPTKTKVQQNVSLNNQIKAEASEQNIFKRKKKKFLY